MNAIQLRSCKRAALLAMIVFVSCMATTIFAAAPAKTEPTATASGETTRAAFQSRAEPLPRLPAVASEGGCEPRYRNGLVGTCINHQPCRGFGVRESDGGASCVCYVKRSGCNADERCDAQEAQCVKDDESEFNREH